MKTMRWLLLLLAMVILTGCAQTIKWDQTAYKNNKATAIQGMKTWSANSGYYSCALLSQKIEFPVTLNSASDFQAVLQNPSLILGIAQLDQLAKDTIDPDTGKPYWNQDDYNLFCSMGIKSRVTTAEVIAIIRAVYPAASAYLPSFQ